MLKAQLTLGAVLAISLASPASAACYEEEHGMTICPPVDDRFFHEPPEIAAAKRECAEGGSRDVLNDPVCQEEVHRELHQLCQNPEKYGLNSADMAQACAGE